MSKQIISAYPTFWKERPEHEDYLNIAEFFMDTIQGEGVNMGCPAAFLRFQNCILSCAWCDTKEVWRVGNPYTFRELYDRIRESGLVDKLKDGHHLVITGGSPLLQQDRLIKFLQGFINEYRFKPYIEIENECTRMPQPEMLAMVDCWNNSPKLSSSGNDFKKRYNALVLGTLGALNNSWFKFVITGEEDWEEISNYYIQTGLIPKDRILLMPEGSTREVFSEHRNAVIEMAIKYNVRYTTREHIVAWDKKTGV